MPNPLTKVQILEWSSLVPRPRPAFRCLQAQTATESWAGPGNKATLTLQGTKPKPQNQLLLFALTLQNVNQKAVHMNIIMWLGFYIYVHSFLVHILQGQRKLL